MAMADTPSSSRKSLSEILRKIIQWRSSPDLIHDEDQLSWTVSHLLAVADYVLKLEGINAFHFSEWSKLDAYFWASPSQKIEKTAIIYTRDLRVFFEMPKISDHTIINKNQLAAAFIDFLLHLLYHKTSSMIIFEDQIDSLEKELGFLLAVLGDAAFVERGAENNILEEFVAVANDAGSLLYSFIFESYQRFKCIRIEMPFDSLLKRIDLLEVDVIRLISNPQSLGRNAAATTDSVDSLFIVDSLLHDLENVMNREDGLIVRDQIKVLHKGQMLSHSLLRDIKEAPNPEIQELKESLTLIRGVAHEAEYLISYFLVGDAALCYLCWKLV